MPDIYIAMQWLQNAPPMWRAINTDYAEYAEGNSIRIVQPGTYRCSIRCDGYGANTGGCAAYLNGSLLCNAPYANYPTTGEATFSVKEGETPTIGLQVGASSALTTGCIKITKI